MNRIRLPKLILIIILFIVLLILSFRSANINDKKDVKINKNEPKTTEKKKNEQKGEKSEQNENGNKETENMVENPNSSTIVQENYQYYRLTSYWTGDEYDTSGCTGSGLCEKDFQVNDKGWYTYNGYLVLAGATTYGKFYTNIPGKRYFRYYEEININIDGVIYKGIILDTCGLCSNIENENRLDLFVSSKQFVIDRGYKGNNMVKVTFN